MRLPRPTLNPLEASRGDQVSGGDVRSAQIDLHHRLFALL